MQVIDKLIELKIKRKLKEEQRFKLKDYLKRVNIYDLVEFFRNSTILDLLMKVVVYIKDK